MANRVMEVIDVFKGKNPGGIMPVAPIYHTAAAGHAGISLKDFANSADKMAETAIWSYRNLGLDGVQLTLGVGVEPEALGAKTVQPEKGLPSVTEHLLENLDNFKKLKAPDPRKDGRMPIFIDAVKKTQDAIGSECCVIATVRGPFNIASQLRGLNNLMLDIYDRPDFVCELLSFTNHVAYLFAKALVEDAKMPVVAIGEALCSSDCISPEYYKKVISPIHKGLVFKLRAAGLQASLLHICGNIAPLLEAVKETGVDAVDIDYKSDIGKVLELGAGLGMRGNLDPAWMLSAKPEEVRKKARELAEKVKGYPWILSSGCDVPYGTPIENIKALKEAI